MFDNKTIIPLIDLTRLEERDDIKAIDSLCNKANALSTAVASICIYPEFIVHAKSVLSIDIPVATVINFPKGNASIDEVINQTKKALSFGADEIDLVIPYQNYLKNDAQSDKESAAMIKGVKALCQDKPLKVIIESGQLKDSRLIKKASEDAIISGADFIKTSTGKASIGATLDAASIMLDTIKKFKNKGHICGFKASGGIRTKKEAISYLELTKDKLGKDFINPTTFRFGASSLLDDLIN